MLSRIVSRSLLSGVRCSSTSSTTQQAAAAAPASERDEVNFPRVPRPIEPAPVRMGFVPQTWFDMLYPKTGVTGPYVLGVGMATFLMSKEYFVIEHEFYSGACMAAIAIYSIKKFGGPVAANLDGQIEDIRKDMGAMREDNIQNIKDQIAAQEEAAEQAKGQPILFEGKRENVGLQLEASYRERLQHVHQEVKKRLDYQLETSNVHTRFQQRHMVDWIVSNVRKSITPDQEAASIKQCISDLKALSAKA